MRRFLAVLAFLALAGCAAAPGPQLYLLEAPAPSGAGAGGPQSVGLREIGLPLYARRVQIASRDPSGAITADDRRRWAEEPPRAATRLVARSLAALRAGAVYADPWPQGASPDFIVTTEVDRFLGALGGDVTLEGQLTVARAGARASAVTGPFAISVPTEGADYAALTAAYGAALAELARRIEAALEAYRES